MLGDGPLVVLKIGMLYQQKFMFILNSSKNLKAYRTIKRPFPTKKGQGIHLPKIQQVRYLPRGTDIFLGNGSHGSEHRELLIMTTISSNS